jgi:hypothetical protein
MPFTPIHNPSAQPDRRALKDLKVALGENGFVVRAIC